ncbi:hypothetical protein AMTRI_Chr05g66440 [Amborella trichopoda]
MHFSLTLLRSMVVMRLLAYDYRIAPYALWSITYLEGWMSSNAKFKLILLQRWLQGIKDLQLLPWAKQPLKS